MQQSHETFDDILEFCVNDLNGSIGINQKNIRHIDNKYSLQEHLEYLAANTPYLVKSETEAYTYSITIDGKIFTERNGYQGEEDRAIIAEEQRIKDKELADELTRANIKNIPFQRNSTKISLIIAASSVIVAYFALKYKADVVLLKEQQGIARKQIDSLLFVLKPKAVMDTFPKASPKQTLDTSKTK